MTTSCASGCIPGRAPSRQSGRTPDGFTMIEIMIVLVILVILAAIALPSYQESIRKGRRAEGHAALVRIMQQQERYYSMHTSYIAFSSESTDADARRFSWFSGEKASSSSYEIIATPCDGEGLRECVVLTALPGTAKVDSRYRDPVCGNLILDSRGKRTANEDRCWR